MEAMTNSDPQSAGFGRDFYDSRYRQGYMREWPAFIRRRVSDVLCDVRLPEHGIALDFGCGNGQFTALLQELLPGWRIVGMDISAVAVTEARSRFPGGDFRVLDDPAQCGNGYDLIFTHHVLEHVPDINATWTMLSAMMKDSGAMLHVLPCGNSGSLEYWLCEQRRNGIDQRKGGRFFFEDNGHLRRMTTDGMVRLAVSSAMALRYEAYCSRFYGAVDWITRAEFSMIARLTSPADAKNLRSALSLRAAGIALSILKVLRYPSNALEDKIRTLSWWRYGSMLPFLAPWYPVSKAVNMLVALMLAVEWKNRSKNRNSSEMFLYFKRQVC